MMKPFLNVLLLCCVLYVVAGCSSGKEKIETHLSENEFVELFYGFTVKRFHESSVPEINSVDNKHISEVLYLIQKYELWSPTQYKRVLQQYQDKKENIYPDQDKWKTLLLKAQNFSIPERSMDKKDKFIEFLKKTYPKIEFILNKQLEYIDNQINQAEITHPNDLDVRALNIDTQSVMATKTSQNKKNTHFVESLYMQPDALKKTQIKLIQWARKTSSNLDELKQNLIFAWMQFLFIINQTM